MGNKNKNLVSSKGNRGILKRKKTSIVTKYSFLLCNILYLFKTTDNLLESKMCV